MVLLSSHFSLVSVSLYLTPPRQGHFGCWVFYTVTRTQTHARTHTHAHTHTHTHTHTLSATYLCTCSQTQRHTSAHPQNAHTFCFSFACCLLSEMVSLANGLCLILALCSSWWDTFSNTTWLLLASLLTRVPAKWNTLLPWPHTAKENWNLSYYSSSNNGNLCEWYMAMWSIIRHTGQTSALPCYLWTVQCGIWTASKYNYIQVICLIKQTKSASVLVFRGLLIHTSTLIQCNLPFKLQVNSKHVILPSWLVTFPSSWSLRSLACDTTSCRGAKDNYTNNYQRSGSEKGLECSVMNSLTYFKPTKCICCVAVSSSFYS